MDKITTTKEKQDRPTTMAATIPTIPTPLRMEVRMGYLRACHNQEVRSNKHGKHIIDSSVCSVSPSITALGSNSNLGGLPLQFFGQMGTGQLTFASEHMGNEISVIRYVWIETWA
jgi:hypothetical protein